MMAGSLKSVETTQPELTTKQRLRRYAIIWLLAFLIPFACYRALIWRTQSRIHELGGTTFAGPPPSYSDLAYTTRLPDPLRVLVSSNAGRWVFSQFPVIYGVDLRSIDDPDSIADALAIAKELDHVTELILYNSAVQNQHLALINKGFPRLQTLKINDTEIGDSGIAHLCGNATLRHIDAQQTDITASAVATFCRIPRLKELNVGETKIKSVQQLRDSNPSCHITNQLVTEKKQLMHTGLHVSHKSAS